jgi:transcriptional regulator of acetoin/glycerol metabolism
VEDFHSLANSSSGALHKGEQGGPSSDFSAGADGISLSSLESNPIAASIAKHNGNLSLVAKELGISRGALYRKIEKHGL